MKTLQLTKTKLAKPTPTATDYFHINELLTNWLKSKYKFKTYDNEYYAKLKYELRQFEPTQFKLTRRIIQLVSFNERLHLCGSKATRTISCRDCGTVIEQGQKFILNCMSRYCKKCASMRYKRAYSRLMEYNIRSKKLLHASFGFPRKPTYHKQFKKQEDYILVEFARRLKKLGIAYTGIRTFDFHRKDDDYSHYHLAFIPKRIKDINLNLWHTVRKSIIRDTGIQFNFHIFGWRPKAKLFHYFAKRMAGLYGDGKKYITYKDDKGKPKRIYYEFMLPDIITPQEYLDNFHNIRSAVLLSPKSSRKGKGSITVPVSELICPNCYSNRFRCEIFPDYADKINSTVGDYYGIP
jgi:hypothetical protein